LRKIFCCMLMAGILQGMAFAQEALTLDEALKALGFLPDRSSLTLG
jgi:hypothetical protein